MLRQRIILSSGFLLVASCLMIAVLRRAPAFDPPSLWLDDQWVALALRQCSLAQVYALHMPTPIGFAWLEQQAMRLSSDPEWPLQIVPYLFGLFEIVVVYALLRRIVKQTWVIALGTLLAACHPVSELYALRVKQYSLDMVACSLLFLLFVRGLQRRDPATLRWLVLGGWLATPFSFSSVFVSACLVHVFALDQWLRVRPNRRAGLVLAGTLLSFELGMAAIYVAYLRDSSNPALREFWQEHFLRFDSAAHVLTFLYKGPLSFFYYALSGPLLVLLPFAMVGGRTLARDPVLRPITWACAGLFLGLLVASALQMFPMGAERTGLFAYPFLWVLAAVGVDRMLTEAPSWSSKPGRYAVLLSAYVAACCLLRPAVSYSDARDRDVVQAARRELHTGDGLLMQPYGALALGYYGGRPVHFVVSNQLSHHFETFPDWPNATVVPRVIGELTVREHPEVAGTLLADFFGRGYPRVLYVSTNAAEQVDAFVVTAAQRRGYAVARRVDASARARLFVFVKLSYAAACARLRLRTLLHVRVACQGASKVG